MTQKRICLANSFLLIVAIACPIAVCQAGTSVQQKLGQSVCSNVVALAGDVNINCSSLTPAQRAALEKIPAMLKQILANENPPALMEKINQILKAISHPSETLVAPNGIVIAGQASVINPTVNNFRPAVRRLAAETKSNLSACLSVNPGTVSIAALSGDGEAYQYAKDWLDAFTNAHWTIADGVIRSFVVGQGDWSGTTIGAKATGTSYDPNTAGGAALKCLLSLPPTDKWKATLYRDTPKDHISVSVGPMPAPSE